MHKEKSKYDVIIIGAGVGGLVCGSYLSKIGMSVLIIEKNSFVGGCCTSFKRNGYFFDAGFHCLGSCGDNGYFTKIIRDLEITDLCLKRLDLSNTVIAPHFKIQIYSDIRKTKDSYKAAFSDQPKQIDAFFALFDKDVSTYSLLKLKHTTFYDYVRKYFKDKRIIASLSIFLANIGVPSNRISAFAALLFLKEFIFGGGCYPIGGAQAISESFRNKFLSLGGDIILSSTVEEILISKGRAAGVKTNRERAFSAEYIVSNCDASQTFTKLIKDRRIVNKYARRMRQRETSNSVFAVFIGLDEKQKDWSGETSYWLMQDYDIDRVFKKVFAGKIGAEESFVFLTSPSMKDQAIYDENGMSIILMVSAPFKSTEYWNMNRQSFEDKLIKRAESYLGSFSRDIKLKINATPSTFYRYTYNKNGAMAGWANTMEQANRYAMPTLSDIENLLLAGHWVTSDFGQGGVAASGHSGFLTARTIMDKVKNNR